LLVTYPQAVQSAILDYLFKPQFASSLHVLKVEIGGDAQSTDGTEASHQHTQDDLNCHRGYEWWLLTEAKKRNPAIRTYGLSWAWPAWTGNFTDSPWNAVPLAANYTLNWLRCARDVYGITIDYVGSWNERSYSAAYLKYLRSELDKSGFNSTLIVAADGSWDIADDMLQDPELAAAVFAVGAHYPGMETTSSALKTGHVLLSSEDDSTFGDNVGTGCWARVLNRNYVEGSMSGTVMWNLVSSYYPGLPWMGTSFMWAYQPWSSNYAVKSAVYVTAHWTQFTQPGWYYLSVGNATGGSGFFKNGGSYSALVEHDDGTGDFSIVMEKIHHDRSKCVRPDLPDYTVAPETAQFQLTGPAAATARRSGRLAVWLSVLRYDGQASTLFERQADIHVPPGTGPVSVSVSVPVDGVVTLSSIVSGPSKGSFPAPPPPSAFPVPYSDSFESYPLHSEASYFADQAGVFEILDTGTSHGKAMMQVVPTRPICWINDVAPVSVFGANTWTDLDVQIDFSFDVTASTQAAASVGARVTGTTDAHGVFVSVTASGEWQLWFDLSSQTIVDSGSVSTPVSPGTWLTLRLQVTGSNATATLNGEPLFSNVDISGCNCPVGWMAIGTGFQYSPVWFDNLHIASATDAGSICAPPAKGQNIALQGASVDATPTLQYDWNNATSQLVLHADPTLCMGIDGKDPNSGYPNVALVACDPHDNGQQWDLVVTDSKTQIESGFQGLGYCLDVTDQATGVGANVEIYPCNGGENQKWVLDEGGFLINTGYSEPKKAAGACVTI
jgi:galactosylceramidase